MAKSFGQQQESTSKNSTSLDLLRESSWSFLESGRQALLCQPSQEHSDGDSSYSTMKEATPAHQREGLPPSKATTIAAYFLKDQLAGRPHVLSSSILSISDRQLDLYKLKFSFAWQYFGLYLATSFLFITFFKSRICTSLMHTYSAIIFYFDIQIGNELANGQSSHPRDTDHHLVFPLTVFLAMLSIQSWAWFLLAEEEEEFSTNVSSLFKPIVLFYLSRHARHALESIAQVSKTLLRVVCVELFLILSFAAIACRLYYHDANFESLEVSWLSLFELSTTVVNPSIWLSRYEEARINAAFFIAFIVICVFYLHSLILSVVFQVFIQSATEVHQRSLLEQERAVHLAFQALNSVDPNKENKIEASLVRSLLEKVRPHYSELKINVLMEIFDPMKRQNVDYDLFRAQIKLALNSSIRSARTNSLFYSAIEKLSTAVSAVNFVYVILLTSTFEAQWFDTSAVSLGFAISIAGLLELLLRFNPFKMKCHPLSGSNFMFDLLALFGGAVSMVGMGLFLAGNEDGAGYVLVGRAIDMFRAMRFFSMFRDVVDRSVSVMPALAGPAILIFTSVHIFVYFGMALWGGAIDAYQLSLNEDVEPLYYLNNFNSYSEGLVTVFNVMVINDWHEIAKVFLYADRCNQTYIVYPYFIFIVLIGVCILLNVITAFFVETFAIKLTKEDLEYTEMTATQRRRDFSIQTASRRENLSNSMSWAQPFLGLQPKSSGSSDNGDLVEFDVFEREGFDEIMKTVGSNLGDNGQSFAESLRDILELVNIYTPGWGTTGFLVFCQQSLNQFTTSRFPLLTAPFLTEEELEDAISDMASRLKSIPETPGKRLLRQFLHAEDPTVMLELLALGAPTKEIMLIVARLKRDST